MSIYPSSVTIHMEFVTYCHEGCAVTFGMPSGMYTNRKNDHATFYCPNGHPQVFNGKTEAEKLKAELALVRANAERTEQNLRKQKEWAQQAEKAATHDAKTARTRAKRAITISRKLRQRLKTGLCPCCEVKFDNLEEHMTAEHPRYR